MKRFLLVLAAAAGLLPAMQIAAQPCDSLAATVDRLSAEVAKLDRRQTTSEKILARLPHISGYIQFNYEWKEDASSFRVKRARVEFKGDISPKIDYRLQLEFASPKIVDAYLRFKPLEALNVQIGQFKVPFTIENTHYAPLKFEFIEYSLVLSRLMGLDDVSGIKSTGRDACAQLYGDLFRREGFSILSYNIGVFNGEGINAKDKNKSKDFVARLMLRPMGSLALAGYYYRGEVGERHLPRNRYGGGICYDDDRWVARGEYVAGRTGIVADGARTTFDSEGFYVMAACWATPQWMPALRCESFDAVSGRKSARQTNYTAGVTYQPWRYLRCQLNYTYERYGSPNPDRNVVSAMLTGVF